MPKYRLMLQRFPYGGIEHTPCVDWLIDAVVWFEKKRPDIELLIAPPLDDTPITMTRNRSVEIARAHGADILLMIDSDMAPDCEVRDDATAKRFLPSSLDFLIDHNGPCVIGAPYCGPPPHENIYVFQWGNMQSHVPETEPAGLKLDQFSREHAAILGGIQEVAALPTGLILFDMRCFDKIKYPYFSYEWKGHGPECQGCGQHLRGAEAEKASTEDVVTTRDLALAGVRQYCNWDAWAGHRKTKTVRKPRPFTVDGVAEKMREAIVARRQIGVSLRDVKPQNPQTARDVEEALQRYLQDPARRLVDPMNRLNSDLSATTANARGQEEEIRPLTREEEARIANAPDGVLSQIFNLEPIYSGPG